MLPEVEECAGYPNEAASLTDIAAHALRMLQRAQCGLHLPCLDLQNPPKEVLDCGCSHFTVPERELASIAHTLEISSPPLESSAGDVTLSSGVASKVGS